MGESIVIGWKQDKKWSDNFLTEIKSAIGRQFICEAPEVEDQERNTDLIVFRMDSIRIGCRIRREKWIANKGEFTIREGRPSGNKTELTKIIEGWGDYFFYGFGSDDGSKLLSWKIGDLKVFRLYLMRHIARNGGALPGRKMNNTDSSSWFRVYQWSEVDGMLIASSD